MNNSIQKRRENLCHYCVNAVAIVASACDGLEDGMKSLPTADQEMQGHPKLRHKPLKAKKSRENLF